MGSAVPGGLRLFGPSSQDHLLAVSATGDFEPRIRFFSEAVRAQAVRGVEKNDALHDWRDEALTQLLKARLDADSSAEVTKPVLFQDRWMSMLGSGYDKFLSRYPQ